MKAFLKRYGSVLYIALMSVVVVVFFACQTDMREVWWALGHMQPTWVAAAVGCMAMYFLLRALLLRFYTGRQGSGITLRQALAVTGAGQFYSAITPSASGGQPAQIVRLVRSGVPAGVATAAVSIEFIGFQGGYLLLGAIAWLTNSRFLGRQIEGFGWLVILGYVLNSVTILAIFLAAANLRALRRLVGALLKLGERLHVLKKPEEKLETVMHTMEDYRSALLALLKHPLDTAVIVAISLTELLVYMSVPLCMYRAFGLTGTPGAAIIGVQLLLFIASGFIPLPGAAGASESGFCLFYRNIFTEDTVVPAMFSWRFFTFYLALVTGFVLMAVDDLRRKRR